MIDEKRMDELQIEDFGPDDGRFEVLAIAKLKSKEEGLELLRLARLGLWAEKHGVRLLEPYKQVLLLRNQDAASNNFGADACKVLIAFPSYMDNFAEALAALPKDDKIDPSST